MRKGRLLLLLFLEGLLVFRSAFGSTSAGGTRGAEPTEAPPSACPRIFHVHRLDGSKNLGDMLSSPLPYFPRLRNATTAVWDVGESARRNVQRWGLTRQDLVVIGGGGLLHAHDSWSSNLLEYCSNARCVLWSPGLNKHHNRAATRQSGKGTNTDRSAVAALLNASAGAALRDSLAIRPAGWPRGLATMLDASCLHPGLDTSCGRKPPAHEAAVYAHQTYAPDLASGGRRSGDGGSGLGSARPIRGPFGSAPSLTNKQRSDGKTQCKVFNFLCSARIVLTSSYHGALWATYMNRSVVLADEVFSEKFGNLIRSTPHHTANHMTMPHITPPPHRTTPPY